MSEGCRKRIIKHDPTINRFLDYPFRFRVEIPCFQPEANLLLINVSSFYENHFSSVLSKVFSLKYFDFVFSYSSYSNTVTTSVSAIFYITNFNLDVPTLLSLSLRYQICF